MTPLDLTVENALPLAGLRYWLSPVRIDPEDPSTLVAIHSAYPTSEGLSTSLCFPSGRPSRYVREDSAYHAPLSEKLAQYLPKLRH